ncbi:BamA/TamA family outer membrane protein [Ferruginibacter paludis]|uniref:BamA/TamA family outer membrane protein n=1 Tax=Ferruginibacter paludis TaxID=1310417 RepID=UPI0025B3C73D|nr:BamA/TamA family outer membrane protein [Ferruginibacter paludis]MDN3658004.1 BamA/TamA family outer membrane protein [Ferruginibacter paludis]
MFLKKSIPIIFLCLAVCTLLTAQQLQDSAEQRSAYTVNNTLPATPAQQDIKDVVKKIFKSNPAVDDETGQQKNKIYNSFFPMAGYTLQTGFAVIVSEGLAFYTDTSRDQKISSILTSVAYTQYHQILFPMLANFWTKHNQLNIVLDYRFIKYPSTTYGLGARTTDDDAYTLNYNYVKLHQTIQAKIYRNLYAGAGIYYDHIWNISEVNPPAGVRTSFQKYGVSQTETASGIALKLLYDSRINQINPGNGAYANIVYRPNFRFMGSDNNWQSLQMDVRKYFKLFGSDKNILALWSFNWLTLAKSKPPYLLLPSTGWDDFYNTGRGYIQSRFRAKDMIYAEAEYRFGIASNGLLGGVVFGNVQSFSKNLATQLAVLAPGFGAGLRVKLNKFSNTNLCIDYGFGMNGSRGVFLNLGEVF